MTSVMCQGTRAGGAAADKHPAAAICPARATRGRHAPFTCHFSPFTCHLPPVTRSGGIFSVALSLGLRPVAVSHHRALSSSDFPPHAAVRASPRTTHGGRLAHSAEAPIVSPPRPAGTATSYTGAAPRAAHPIRPPHAYRYNAGMGTTRCDCRKLSFAGLRSYAQRHNITSLSELIARTGCCTGCGTCREHLQAFLRTGEVRYGDMRVKIPEYLRPKSPPPPALDAREPSPLPRAVDPGRSAVDPDRGAVDPEHTPPTTSFPAESGEQQ